MKVLLVEPDSKISKSLIKKIGQSPEKPLDDDLLLYPPLGLMKLASYHLNRGDEVCFVRGIDASLFKEPDLFSPGDVWDRVYVTTLFTYDFIKTVEMINFYKKAVGGSIHKIYIGGIMASLMPEEIFNDTGIYPKIGIINTARQLDFEDDTDIDKLVPSYGILDERMYAINDTFYAYTSRGCIQKCDWCGVPTLEPKFIPYIDIKPTILKLKALHGDKPRIKLMDNNVLASPHLSKIVDDLVSLGFGRGTFTDGHPKKKRVVDFNQGLDATYLTESKIKLLAKLNIKPLRIAFDRLSEKEDYIAAVELCDKYGFNEISNYMLYNCNDSPEELYERIKININLNEKLRNGRESGYTKIYSYPMRFAPIRSYGSNNVHMMRDYVKETNGKVSPNKLTWNKKFLRNIEVMKSVAHGAISTTPSLALRTVGRDSNEFLTNLYLPEIMLRNRNHYEGTIYPGEPKRKRGNGKIEEFRRFLLEFMNNDDVVFKEFHEIIAKNSIPITRDYLKQCNNKEVKRWLRYYLKK